MGTGEFAGSSSEGAEDQDAGTNQCSVIRLKDLKPKLFSEMIAE
jgi:hypothetical protein